MVKFTDEYERCRTCIAPTYEAFCLKEITMKEEIWNIIRTFQAVGPVLENALKSGQLFNPQCELIEPDPDVLCEDDV